MKIKNKEISKSVLLTRARHQQLRVYAAMHNKTISSIVDEAINLYINNTKN